MTSFEQLLGHLRAVLGQPDPDAGRAARVWFRGFKRERYASLPRTPLEALGREETALYSLRADPFGGELFALAAAVAESAGGDPGPFRAQHSRYQARFGRALGWDGC